MPRYFDFEASLVGIKPQIWRRFLLMEKASFANLHDVIQAAFGWENYHLYEFREKGRRGGRLCRADYENPYDEDDAPVAEKVRLRDVFARRRLHNSLTRRPVSSKTQRTSFSRKSRQALTSWSVSSLLKGSRT